jgi:hypothetical protein
MDIIKERMIYTPTDSKSINCLPSIGNQKLFIRLFEPCLFRHCVALIKKINHPFYNQKSNRQSDFM